jgi:hypothetical protein
LGYTITGADGHQNMLHVGHPFPTALWLIITVIHVSDVVCKLHRSNLNLATCLLLFIATTCFTAIIVSMATLLSTVSTSIVVLVSGNNPSHHAAILQLHPFFI